MSSPPVAPPVAAERAVTKPKGGFHWEHMLGVIGALLFVAAQGLALFWSPADQHMGEVSRILHVHVPAAWGAMVAFTVGFVAAAGFLFTGRRGFDWVSEGSVEVGVVLSGLMLVLGSMFGRRTWGVWWSWDPRLTASAVMMLTFVGVVMLRQVVEDSDKRALWSTVSTVLAFVNIPVTYMSVRWWRSLHQVQSTTNSMSGDIAWVLRLNALAFLFLSVWMIVRRYRIAHHRAWAEAPDALPGVPS
jgi:heme exporter protein C